MKIKCIALAGAVVLAALSMAPQAEAGTLGCLVGAGAGGFGGAQIGKGNGKLAAVAIGTLLGCGVGSKIQDSDQQAYNGGTYNGGQQYGTYNGGQQYGTYNGGYYGRQVFTTAPRRRHWSHQRHSNERHHIQPQPVQVVQNDCPSNYTREYQTKVTVGGQQVPAYGTACYQPDGTWKLGPAVPAR